MRSISRPKSMVTWLGRTALYRVRLILRVMSRCVTCHCSTLALCTDLLLLGLPFWQEFVVGRVVNTR